MCDKITLLHSHVFGFKSDVADNVHYIDETMVIYPAGHNVVVYNLESKVQRFIHGSTDIAGATGISTITAIALSPNRRYAGVSAVITK
jgi:hypothetical protein